MVDLSYLFSLADFSLTDFLFGEDKSKKKNKSKTENNKNIKKVEDNKEKKHIDINKLNEKEKKLILKLEIEIDNFLYRKRVKSLIEKNKEYYIITCSANIPKLFINIINSKKPKQYKLIYEPILKQNVVFLPRKKYRNKKKLKFNFVNSKNEIFIEPKYKTENNDCSFINVIDLRELKEKEYKNDEDFEIFLKELRAKKKENKIINEINEMKESKKEETSEENKTNEDSTKKIENLNDKNEFDDIKKNSLTDKKQIYSNEDLKYKKIKKRKLLFSSLNSENKNSLGINSILKERNPQKEKNQRKISFGDVEFSY